MGRTSYTAEQKAAALELYVELGAAAASERTGVPAATLRSWASRAGRQTERAGHVAAATEAAKASAEERRATLADQLLDDALQLRAGLWEHRPQLVGRGEDATVVDLPLAPRDQLDLLRAMDVAVRNVQLLTGQDTERVGTGGLDLEAELHAYQAGLQDGASSSEPAPS